MTGAAIAIDGVSAADTILSVKWRVYAVNQKLPVRQQRLMYRPGPHGISPLADEETLGGAGVAQDGTAELDVLLEPLTEAEASEKRWWELRDQVWRGLRQTKGSFFLLLSKITYCYGVAL